MWYREHSIIIKTTKDCIWPLLTQPELWPSYDKTVCESALHGEIAVGVSGKMKKVSGDVVDFTVTELVENERIVIQVKKLGARVITIYMLDDAEEGVKVTSRIELRGLFSWFHRSTVRKQHW